MYIFIPWWDFWEGFEFIFCGFLLKFGGFGIFKDFNARNWFDFCKVL